MNEALQFTKTTTYNKLTNPFLCLGKLIKKLVSGIHTKTFCLSYKSVLNDNFIKNREREREL